MDIPVNAPFTVRIVAATTGDPATFLRLYQNGVQVGQATPSQTGDALFPFANGLPAGTYTFEGSALNATGESPRVSAILVVAPVAAAPDRPQSITIILG